MEHFSCPCLFYERLFLFSVLVMVLAIRCGIDVSRSMGAFHFWKIEPKYHTKPILKAYFIPIDSNYRKKKPMISHL